MEADDDAGALAAAKAVLGDFDPKVMARAAVVTGRNLPSARREGGGVLILRSQRVFVQGGRAAELCISVDF